MASVEASQEQESGDIQEMQSQVLPNSLDKGTKTSLCVCVWCRTMVFQWWETTAESRNHCSLTCRSQLSSTTLSMHRSWLLVPSVMCRHQEGEFLSKCFHLKLQMLPTAFQCQPCPALHALQRRGIRRHSRSCSLRLLPATKFITQEVPDLQPRGKTGFKVMALNRAPFQSTQRFSLPPVYKPGYYKACEHFKSFHWNTRASAIHTVGSKVVKELKCWVDQNHVQFTMDKILVRRSDYWGQGKTVPQQSRGN